MIGPCLLVVGAVIAYGVSTYFQSHAAELVPTAGHVDPSLLVRLARQRTYLIGVGCQLVGFALAFFARERLPLFLVQPAVSSSLGITLIIGIATSRWHLGAGQLAFLLVTATGLTCLGVAATTSTASSPTVALAVGLGVAAVALVAVAKPALAMTGRVVPVLLGGLSGAGFGGAAVAARGLTADLSPTAVLASPLSYLLVVYLVIGQYLFAAALQRRNVSGSTAAMYAVTTASSALVGLLALNDRWRPGMLPLVALGILAALAGAFGLSRYTTEGVSESGQHDAADHAEASDRGYTDGEQQPST